MRQSVIKPDVSAPRGRVVASFDTRPFFEKALAFGIDHGLIGRERLAAMEVEAPKGMVQIARYFGSEYLRPELERARERLVNLVSLHLQDASGGDLRAAATLLQQNTLLSRSKAGSDLLKALIVMPQSSHFGMNERGGFADRHIPQLARWSLASYADYRAEYLARERAAQTVAAAIWFAARLGTSADDLQDAEPDAEAVIRTALLVLATRRKALPDWTDFEKMVTALRSKHAAGDETALASLATRLGPPTDLPAPYRKVVLTLQQSVLADLPRLLDARLPVRKLFDQTPAFMGRYFWLEDALSEVGQHDRARSAAWERATGGHSDDASLLTLFLCVAVGAAAKTVLTEKTAASLIRKLRKNGLDASLANAWILAHVPIEQQDDCVRLWQDFVAQAKTTLLNGRDGKLDEALALLRRECNVCV